MNAALYVVPTILLVVIIVVFFGGHRLRRAPASDEQNASSATQRSPLQSDDQQLIRNLARFQEGIVREVMIPRIDIVAVEETANLETFRLFALEQGHSRIPIFRKTIDHIVGMAYMNDLLRYWDVPDKDAVTMLDLMRPPYFVPETKNIKALLREFQAQKTHVAIAIDEYGGTAGIVTMEDLLEVVFGDLYDEHDEDEIPLVSEIDAQTFEINAKASIAELERHVGALSVEPHDVESVGGLLCSLLGEVPAIGVSVEYQRMRLTVTAADPQRVIKVKVERLSALSQP